MVIQRLYKKSEPASNKLNILKQITDLVSALDVELCYNVESCSKLNQEEINLLRWIISSPFDKEELSFESRLNQNGYIIEIGPRLNFSTALSSNAVSICRSVGLTNVTRIEVSTRYQILTNSKLTLAIEKEIENVLHDRMTECRYEKPIESFDHGFEPENWFEVDILREGKKALEKVNAKLGLAFDEWDLDFYTDLFQRKLKRNPTSVECFDLAQSNSEHSRHWFFRGNIVINGQEKEASLFDMIVDTQTTSNPNNVIKFSDNSSAIKGFRVQGLRPTSVVKPSDFELHQMNEHLIFTAETHNFPTGVAPFSGATTGTGGRIRDIQGIGRGGSYIAGTAGYSVGSLNIPGYKLPWEDDNVEYPSNMASPLEIIIEASNGASDYGNKFGEPVISGFARSFGMLNAAGCRREWIKPIMFSGGLGTVNADMTQKLQPKKGMKVVKVGGPVYRIGVGGGSASSVEVQGDNNADLDFGAVQRGDAEMEQKLNRFVRACVEMGSDNPILSIHDQGAGGNGNVLKELVEPAGAVIFTNKFELGDPSISTLELWGAEYQENDALLCEEKSVALLEKIAQRERCPINIVGTVTGNGKIILSEDQNADETQFLDGKNDTSIRHPVDLDLELVLGKMPRKTFNFTKELVNLTKVSLSEDVTVVSALERVLRLPSVASKRYLTNKVDRCVTGLIAQQQCVGPIHTPLADVAVTAISHFSTVGIATSIGEQPIKGLVNAVAGARMTVAECLTNLVFAKISDIKDVKCSGNWMWPAKLPGEGAALYEACVAMCAIMKQLGIAIDGGKDSLSMAARIGNDVVKSPGTLVVSAYAPCPDITQVVTPDLKSPHLKKNGCLLFVDLSYGKSRIGGTSLAQVYKQLGDETPDVENAHAIVNAFSATQQLIEEKKILSGHDISDGGLITCLLEMCFAGISGINVDITHKSDSPINILFAEEVGWVLEVDESDCNHVMETFSKHNAPIYKIGYSSNVGVESKIIVSVNGNVQLNSTVLEQMKLWEETSYQLEKRQTNINCAIMEYESLKNRRVPAFKLTFDPDSISSIRSNISESVNVAVIREEGINGDREMAASLIQAGFTVWDVTVQDLLKGEITLDKFRGIIFPGGFSYADVFGSAKGWAASLLFHPTLQQQLKTFVERRDTFSLGVCNGCQLLSLLGWIGNSNNENPNVVLSQNKSERFECRWATVRIEETPAIMLRGMAGTVFGIWVAHGEGRFTFRNQSVFDSLKQQKCLAMKYTDDSGVPSEKYPYNPNGSIEGTAAVCSADGRHLAMMPHPERCTLNWQLPWVPADWQYNNSPWRRLFENAFEWCVRQN